MQFCYVLFVTTDKATARPPAAIVTVCLWPIVLKNTSLYTIVGANIPSVE